MSPINSKYLSYWPGMMMLTICAMDAKLVSEGLARSGGARHISYGLARTG